MKKDLQLYGFVHLRLRVARIQMSHPRLTYLSSSAVGLHYQTLIRRQQDKTLLEGRVNLSEVETTPSRKCTCRAARGIYLNLPSLSPSLGAQPNTRRSKSGSRGCLCPHQYATGIGVSISRRDKKRDKSRRERRKERSDGHTNTKTEKR